MADSASSTRHCLVVVPERCFMKKVTNQTVKEADEASGKRVVMRELMGSELLRELVLK